LRPTPARRGMWPEALHHDRAGSVSDCGRFSCARRRASINARACGAVVGRVSLIFAPLAASPSLIDLSLTKNPRRIRATVSTTTVFPTAERRSLIRPCPEGHIADRFTAPRSWTRTSRTAMLRRRSAGRRAAYSSIRATRRGMKAPHSVGTRHLSLGERDHPLRWQTEAGDLGIADGGTRFDYIRINPPI